MKQLMQEIGQWHEETFPDATMEVVADKLVEEAEEVKEEAAWKDRGFSSSGLNEEVADAFIVLASIIYRANIQIESEVKKKMEKNRNRRWVLQQKWVYQRKK